MPLPVQTGARLAAAGISPYDPGLQQIAEHNAALQRQRAADREAERQTETQDSATRAARTAAPRREKEAPMRNAGIYGGNTDWADAPAHTERTSSPDEITPPAFDR